MQEMKLPDGERITYGYDRGGQLLGVGSSKNTAYVTKILYNATGQRTSITYANGITTKYAYHPKNHRLETLTTSGEDGTLQEISYEYDKVGNVTERESSYTGTDGKKKTVTHSYTYDENDRLTKAEGGIEKEAGILRPDIVTYKSSYTYDAIGNILNKTQSVNGQASATLTHNNDYQYTIDKPHAVTKAGNMLYTYDANGNMLTRENTKTKAKMTLVWDNENRLKQSIDSSYTTDYRYDANGERILKSSDMGELEYVSASYVVRNGTIVSKHIFAGNGRVASAVGNLTDEGKTTTNNVLYYHPDHLGSSSYVTDKQGRFYEAIEYLPYGETLYNERTENDGVSYKYTGKEEDAETGLYYYGARYYDAKLCRWLSVDPILESYLGGKPAGGVFNNANINLYAYCLSNPVRYIDTKGEYIESPWDVFALGVSLTLCGNDWYSFFQDGSETDAIDVSLSTGAVVLDVAAVVLPVPGGAGPALSAYRLSKLRRLKQAHRIASSGVNAATSGYTAYKNDADALGISLASAYGFGLTYGAGAVGNKMASGVRSLDYRPTVFSRSYGVEAWIPKYVDAVQSVTSTAVTVASTKTSNIVVPVKNQRASSTVYSPNMAEQLYKGK